MEGFTYIDGVVALVIILSALLAYGRGLVREIMAITGWIVAAILGYAFAPRVEPLVREIPGLGSVVGESCDLSTIGAFFIVFTVALIIASFFTPLFSSLIRRSALGGLDQGLGFMFGVMRGLLLVAIAFFVYDTVITGQEFTVVDESRSAAVFGRFTGDIQDQDPQLALGWITEKYEALVSGCSAK